MHRSSDTHFVKFFNIAELNSIEFRIKPIFPHFKNNTKMVSFPVTLKSPIQQSKCRIIIKMKTREIKTKKKSEK